MAGQGLISLARLSTASRVQMFDLSQIALMGAIQKIPRLENARSISNFVGQQLTQQAMRKGKSLLHVRQVPLLWYYLDVPDDTLLIHNNNRPG